MADNLRNFKLTVEEIKMVRMMKELVEGLEKLAFDDPLSPRAEFFRWKKNWKKSGITH